MFAQSFVEIVWVVERGSGHNKCSDVACLAELSMKRAALLLTAFGIRESWWCGARASPGLQLNAIEVSASLYSYLFVYYWGMKNVILIEGSCMPLHNNINKSCVDFEKN